LRGVKPARSENKDYNARSFLHSLPGSKGVPRKKNITRKSSGLRKVPLPETDERRREGVYSVRVWEQKKARGIRSRGQTKTQIFHPKGDVKHNKKRASKERKRGSQPSQ